jgi:two-component system chemotaxis response regulator CheY
MKILIVDDSRAMRMIVKRTLRQAGFGDHTMEEAVNGADALNKIDALEPDLVLCDWHMPEMTGIELLQAIQSSERSVRLGFITSQGTTDMRKRAKDAGALFLIAKPFTVDAFRATLTQYLSPN